jgi:hypothetical protein
VSRKEKKHNSAKSEEQLESSRKLRKLLEDVSNLTDELNELDYDGLKLDADDALLHAIQQLQTKLASLPNVLPGKLESFQNQMQHPQKGHLDEEQKRKEGEVSKYLNLNSWYRDRSSLPEQKLVQFVGEENPSGSGKRYRFRDRFGNYINLDANAVLNRMEPAV